MRPGVREARRVEQTSDLLFQVRASAPGAVRENPFARSSWQSREHAERRPADRADRSPGLGRLEAQTAGGFVNLAPAKRTNFFPARAGQSDQTKGGSRGQMQRLLLSQHGPERCHLSWRQKTVIRFPTMFFNAARRVWAADEPALLGP
jgi:hypothetical protein